MLQPNEFADLVVLTVKSAQAPLLERVAAADALAAVVRELTKTLAEVRDRLVVVETKAALPIQPDTELRDRVVALEHKAMPAFEMPAEFATRLAAVEARPVPVAVEKAIDLTPLSERVVKLEALFDAKAGETLPILASVADLSKDLMAVREKVAAIEVRAQVPGPPGEDGTDGKDGADGMGFDDVRIEHDGDRTFTFKYARGDREKTAGAFTLPVMIYRGPFEEGKTYDAGDVVSWAGSSWHCDKKTSTVKPDSVGRDPRTGEPMGVQGHDFWKMVVRSGREGKPGRDGRDAMPLPVVSVGGR